MAETILRTTICLLLLALAETSDLLDGFLARRLKAVSQTGQLIDPWADSISRLTIYWTLAITGLILPAVPLVMAIRDVTVSYCRILIAQKGLSTGALSSGKIKAIIQGGGALVIVASPLYLDLTGHWPLQAISWTVMTVTALSAIEYLLAALRKHDQE